MGLHVYWFEGGQLLTVAVGSLHVVFHVALLGEPDAAHLTLKGFLSSVFDHVDLQSALLVEGLVTLTALEGTFACRTSVPADNFLDIIVKLTVICSVLWYNHSK